MTTAPGGCRAFLVRILRRSVLAGRAREGRDDPAAPLRDSPMGDVAGARAVPDHGDQLVLVPVQLGRGHEADFLAHSAHRACGGLCHVCWPGRNNHAGVGTESSEHPDRGTLRAPDPTTRRIHCLRDHAGPHDGSLSPRRREGRNHRHPVRVTRLSTSLSGSPARRAEDQTPSALRRRVLVCKL